MSNVTAKQVEAAKKKYEAAGLRIEQAKAQAGYKRGSGMLGELQKKKGDLYTAYLELKRKFEAAEEAKAKIDESFFTELEDSLTAFAKSREALGVVGKSTMTKGSGTADDPFLSEDAGRYTMVADMIDLAKKLDTSVHFVHEGYRYVATLRGIMEGDEFDSLDELDEAKVAPGTTKDEHYGAWIIRYDLRPVTGSKEYRGKAWHEKSKLTPPISLTGTSADDVRAKLISTIDSTKSQKEIDPRKYVSIDFNVLVTRHIVGHKDSIFCDVEKIDGTPTLLISATPQPGFQRAEDRTALAQRGEHRTGQHAFSFRGDKAIAAGLTHARYALGDEFEYTNGVTGYPLKFSSEVHPGEMIRLNEPGVTVAYPRNVAEGANEEGVFEGIFSKKENPAKLQELTKEQRDLIRHLFKHSNVDVKWGSGEDETYVLPTNAHAAYGRMVIAFRNEGGQLMAGIAHYRNAREAGDLEQMPVIHTDHVINGPWDLEQLKKDFGGDQREREFYEGNSTQDRDTDFSNFDGWLGAGIELIWPEAVLSRKDKKTIAKVGNRIVGEWDHSTNAGYVELSEGELDEGKTPVSKAKVRPVKDRNDVTTYEVCNSDGVTVKGGMSKEEANRYLIANRASLNLDESVQKRGTSIPKETYSDYREFEKAARAIARKDYTQIMFRPSETENAEYLVITDNTPSGERIIGKWNHDTDTGTIENNMNWGNGTKIKK